MKPFYYYVLGVLGFALFPSDGEAAEPISPEAFISRALAHNPELKYYRAEIAATKGALKTAGTIRNPELSTQGGYKNTRDNSGGASGDGGTFALSANQTFEYPGRIALRKAIAKGDIELAELHLAQFQLALTARVRVLVYGVLVVQEKLATVREVADRFEALSNVLAQREAAGPTAILEARIIEANSLTFRRQERETTLAVKTSLVQLNQLCGESVAAPLQLRNARVVFTEAPPVTSLLDRIADKSFDIRIREAELAQQGFKVSLSKNERYPAITVSPFYSYERAADLEQQAGVGMSLPLPLWDRNAGNIQIAKAREEQARASLLTAQREVERRLAENATIFEIKRKEIDRWQTGTLEKFRESAELADRNYRLGSVPLALYIETQKQYLELVSSVLDMQREALQAAQELEILTGLVLYKVGQQP